MTSIEIIDQYCEAFSTGDFETILNLLHEDFQFQGPSIEFNNAFAFITALKKMKVHGKYQIIKRLTVGSTVAQTYNWIDKKHPNKTFHMCEWFDILDGKISNICVFYDTAKVANINAA